MLSRGEWYPERESRKLNLKPRHERDDLQVSTSHASYSREHSAGTEGKAAFRQIPRACKHPAGSRFGFRASLREFSHTVHWRGQAGLLHASSKASAANGAGMDLESMPVGLPCASQYILHLSPPRGKDLKACRSEQ